ncbi:MAG: acylphosphatase [Alphaproteobacteria bacterium]
MKTVEVRIDGRVQGVWFRGWTVAEAIQRGLAGWVRNRHDGSVQALFHGPAGQVDDMVGACHVGPPAARVDRVVVTPAPPPEGGSFRQLPTR